uniref:Uncharacterized protein n=1 Tax=Eutreptiella gymnastica TaxID=73025 RepID=A0A7S4LFP3_9EUGL
MPRGAPAKPPLFDPLPSKRAPTPAQPHRPRKEAPRHKGTLCPPNCQKQPPAAALPRHHPLSLREGFMKVCAVAFRTIERGGFMVWLSTKIKCPHSFGAGDGTW